MNDAPLDLVTVAILPSSAEATLARNQLEAAGIKAYLIDEETAATVWHMAGALGGTQILEDRPWQHLPEEDPTAVATPETLQRLGQDESEDDEVLSEREQDANRAARVAMAGLIILPLLAYALFLLVKVYFSREKLEGRPRSNAVMAACITLPVFAILGVAVAALFRGPVSHEVDLRDFPHPSSMIGVWNGTFPIKEGEVGLTMTLRGSGKLLYKERGAADVECTGTWAYDNWTLWLRYDRFVRGEPAQKGQILGYPIEDFKDGQMVMVTNEAKIRLVRQ
jgi:hypothetical protein